MFEDGSRLVNEIFNFRVNTIPDEIFNTPELAPCKVRQFFPVESKINGHESMSTAPESRSGRSLGLKFRKMDDWKELK